MMLWDIDTSSITQSQSELVTNVLVSLFTDRRALDSDDLPSGGTDKRGFWGDSFRKRNLGSRLWLLSREKQLQSVMDKAEQYANEALKWLVEDKLVKSVSAQATNPIKGALLLTISITQKDGQAPLQLSFKAQLNGN